MPAKYRPTFLLALGLACLMAGPSKAQSNDQNQDLRSEAFRAQWRGVGLEMGVPPEKIPLFLKFLQENQSNTEAHISEQHDRLKNRINNCPGDVPQFITEVKGDNRRYFDEVKSLADPAKFARYRLRNSGEGRDYEIFRAKAKAVLGLRAHPKTLVDVIGW